MDYALRRHHIRSCVLDALDRHGVAHDSPLCAELEANAVIGAGADSPVVMNNGNSLDAEIENWISSRSMAGSFTTGPRTLTKSDTDSVQSHFADIASGKVRVTE